MDIQMQVFGIVFKREKKKKNKLRLVPIFRNIREQNLAQARYVGPMVFPNYTFGKRKRRYLMATLQMTDTQQADLSISYSDKRGNPVPAPTGGSAPVWMTDNTDLLNLASSPDGSTCTVRAAGPLGTGKVSIKVSDTAGNALASGDIDVIIVGGAPTNVVVTAGTPSEQP